MPHRPTLSGHTHSQSCPTWMHLQSPGTLRCSFCVLFLLLKLCYFCYWIFLKIEIFCYWNILLLKYWILNFDIEIFLLLKYCIYNLYVQFKNSNTWNACREWTYHKHREWTFQKWRQNTNKVDIGCRCKFMKQKILNPLRPLLNLYYPRIYFHAGPAHYQCSIFHLNFTCSNPFSYTPHSQSYFQIPNFLRTFPELSHFVTGCLNHYSYHLLITTVFWETASPPTNAFPPITSVLILHIESLCL